MAVPGVRYMIIQSTVRTESQDQPDDDRGQDERGQNVRAVDRALDILLAFGPEDDGLTVAELLKRVALSRPTLYRLLGTLERSGFLLASGEPQCFRLGPAVARLAHSWTASQSLSVVAEPMMRRLWSATGETVALFVPDGEFRLCLAELPSAQALSFRRGIGYRERLVRGASGRAVLAFTPGVEAELARSAADLPMDLPSYRRELTRVRARGFAVSKHELIEGAVAIAAPFFDGADRVAGSLGVFGPSVRLSAPRIETVGRLLVTETRALSAQLGHRAPAPAATRAP